MERRKEMINKIKALENKKTYMLIIILSLLLFLSLIRLVLKDTHAFYNSQSDSIPIFKAKIGDFTGEGESVKEGPIDKNTDVNIIFYMQMPDNPDKYKESKYVPANGYKVNEKDSNCYPTSGEITYSNYKILEDGTVHLEYKETKPTQVVCRIYYDRNELSDVIIYAYLEDASGDRKYNNKTYKLVNQVESNYTLVAKECKNNKATFTYDNTAGFKILTDGPDTCYAYFRKS